MDGSTARWRVWWPVVAMLIVVVLPGYPLALLFGLPLARRDMVDLRKWIKETVVAQAPLVPDGATLHYNTAPAAGALIWRQALIGRAQVDPGTERVLVPNGFDAPVTIGPPFERLGPVLFRGATPLAADEVGTAIYTAGRLQMQGSVLALERPDGQATRYTSLGTPADPCSSMSGLWRKGPTTSSTATWWCSRRPRPLAVRFAESVATTPSSTGRPGWSCSPHRPKVMSFLRNRWCASPRFWQERPTAPTSAFASPAQTSSTATGGEGCSSRTGS